MSILRNIKNYFLEEYWSIGIFRQHCFKEFMDSDLEPEWLLRSKKFFLADPFPFVFENTKYIIAEYFSFSERKGRLVVLPDKNHITLKDIQFLKMDDFHYSYPFAMEKDGKWYCIPECFQSNKIALFEITNENGEFGLTPVKDLITNIAALDSTLLQYSDRWWLFCTLEGNSRSSALHIFYADDLFGEWKPHRENPVLHNSPTLRPAGRIVCLKDKIFRPSQDSSQTYGGQLQINQIEELSIDSYRESVYKTKSPKSFKMFSNGLHTMNFSDRDLIVDGKMIRFSPLKPFHLLRNKFERKLT